MLTALFAAADASCLLLVILCSFIVCKSPYPHKKKHFRTVYAETVYTKILSCFSSDKEITFIGMIEAPACQACTVIFMILGIKVYVTGNIKGAFLTVCISAAMCCLTQIITAAAVAADRNK